VLEGEGFKGLGSERADTVASRQVFPIVYYSIATRSNIMSLRFLEGADERLP
jgi:hypothetical protein